MADAFRTCLADLPYLENDRVGRNTGARLSAAVQKYLISQTPRSDFLTGGRKLDVKKLRAIDICQADMVTADEGASLFAVSRLMREHHVGDVVLTRGGEEGAVAIGILTDRDIVVHGIAGDISLDDVTAGDLSAQTLVTIEPDADISEIAATMNEHAVRRVVVRRDADYVGIISFEDVLWALSQTVSNLSALTERQIQRETAFEN